MVGTIELGLRLFDWGWDYWTGVGTIHVRLGTIGLGLGPYMYWTGGQDYTCISYS